MTTDVAKHFIAQSRGFLSSDYLPKIERCLDGLSDEDVWWRANEGSNSIGNLLLHLEGSTRAWIIGVAGGLHNPRDRHWQTMERGYDKVTADSIAKAAGAGKQTLYRWWPSKAAVVLEALAEKSRARIDRPTEAAVRAGDLLGFLRGVIPAIAAIGPALRHVMAEAQFDPTLRALLREKLIDPRREPLRQILAARVSDAHRREALIAAIYGAVWYRLLLDEPVDEALAIELAALAPPR